MWNTVRNKNTVILHSWPPPLTQPTPSCFMSAKSAFISPIYLIFPDFRALVDFSVFYVFSPTHGMWGMTALEESSDGQQSPS